MQLKFFMGEVSSLGQIPKRSSHLTELDLYILGFFIRGHTALYGALFGYHSTSLHWNALYCFYCTVLSCTVFYCPVLHCTAMHCIVQHWNAWQCTALLCTSLYCTALHCTSVKLPNASRQALHCQSGQIFGLLYNRETLLAWPFGFTCVTLCPIFSKHRPSGPMLSISRNVHMCVCVFVCVCVHFWGTV